MRYALKSVGGELGFLFEPNFSFQNLIAGLLEGELNQYQQQPEPDKVIYCQSCGLTFSDFRNGGVLGCGDCYRYFRSGLEPLLKRVQGSVKHSGKVPRRIGGKVRIRKEIDQLREELKQAVNREDYESAVKLRDEIKSREQEL